MKNIYVVGVARSGKSTLTRLIKERFPMYNQFSFEAIRNGFIETQPELKMNNRHSKARKEILPKHIVTFANWNSHFLHSPSLIEGTFCTVEELYNLLDENDYIICLGLGCKQIEEIARGVKMHDTNDDYTKEWTEEQIKAHFYDIPYVDQKNYEFCQENNIDYFDTFENREEVFDEILKRISKELIYSK